MPRGIELRREGQHHRRGQAASRRGRSPLNKNNADKLLEIITRFTALYFCAVAGLEIMGSDYQLVLCFEAFRARTSASSSFRPSVTRTRNGII